MKNDNSIADEIVTISWLCDETNRLTWQLTFDIELEQQIYPRNRRRECKFMFM